MIANQQIEKCSSSSGVQASWFQRLCQNAVLGVFGKVTRGHLEIALPDGTTFQAGDPTSDRCARMTVVHPRFFAKVATGSDIGFGESYMDGDWQTNDLFEVLSVLALNQEAMAERSLVTSFLGQFLNKLKYSSQENSHTGSRKNISHHYDLSNDFFKLMLDETMAYSSALFRSPDDTLYDGQMNKIRTLIDKAQLESHHHLLEIGSGWGALAIEAVRRTGCRVTTITLSKEQLAMVQERVKAAGLEDRITPVLIDYRDVQGTFDRIISVEMMEAVGEKYLPVFFGCCDRLLAPNGLLVLQVITMPESRFEQYRRSTDWIQKYIFPGCLVPSFNLISESATKGSSLQVESLENIGIHYARTLREWRERFHNASVEVRELGFDERFTRMWDYYLCYCEAGFQERILGDLHLVFTRTGNTTLPVYT